MTAVAADGSYVESVTTFEGEKAIKAVVEVDKNGDVVAEYTVTRENTDDGYLLTYDSEKTVEYSYVKVIDDATKGNYTETETYTIVDEEGVVTVYEFINKYEKVTNASNFDHIITYRKTVDGEVEAQNVSTFLYKNSGGSHTNKNYIATFNSEFKALGELFSEADLGGKHIADTRLAYSELSLYNTFRWYDATNTYKTATYNFYYLHYSESLDAWGLYRDDKKDASLMVTLPNEIGVWSHITLVVEADNTSYTNSKVHFFFNGEYLDTYKLSEKSVSSYKFMSIEDWRFTTSEVLPQGDSNYFNIGLDNITVNVYTPTLTYGEDGSVLTRTPYSSGEAFGIDDICANLGEAALIECSDTIYNSTYVLPNDNY